MKIFKTLIVSVFFIFLNGCGNFVFVYDTNKIDNILKNNTELLAVGDDANIVSMKINKRLKKINERKYLLKITSSKEQTNLVTKSNQVATVIKIQFTLDYELIKISEGCDVFKSNIVTEESYDAKSEGYSFGTELSKSKLIEDIIQNNIDKFLIYVSDDQNVLKCMG